jgi:hypothetical protein
MTKKIFILLLLGVLLSGFAEGLEFQKSFNENGLSGIASVIQITDDEYVLVISDLTNTGSTNKKGLFELRARPDGVLMSLLTNSQTCDPSFPYNRHIAYDLAPGQKVTLEIYVTLPPGTWDLMVTHANTCCTDGVNKLPCSGLQPFGFETYAQTVVVGDPYANSDDQCDHDYDALVYLRNNGLASCSVAKCENPSSSSSTAVCLDVGVCEHEAIQYQTCDDGSLVGVRICQSGVWELTGSVCSDNTPLITEPKNNSLDKKTVLGLGIILVGSVISLTVAWRMLR